MNLRKPWSSLIPVIVFSVQSPAFADEMRGIIQKVDQEKGELIVETVGLGRRGLPMTFRLTNETRASVNGQTAALADVPTGVRARVDYEVRDGTRLARGIAVRALLRKPQPAPADDTRVTGAIQRISFTEREIVVSTPGARGQGQAEATFVIPEYVSITKDKKAVKLDDIREGEQVTVFTQMRDGKKEVASMVIGDPGPAALTNAPRIEQLRKVLRIADLVLEQVGKQKEAPKP
jgi:hypothetical protein